MSTTMDTGQFLRGIGTNFHPLEFRGLRQVQEEVFNFDFAADGQPPQRFSVSMRWHEMQGPFYLWMLVRTRIPFVGRYGWALTALNEDVHDANTGVVARAVVLGPEQGEEKLTLRFNWAADLDDFDLKDPGGVESARHIVRRHIIRLVKEADAVEGHLYKLHQCQTLQ